MPNPTLKIKPTGGIQPVKMNAENERLWVKYCGARDFLVEMHKDCLAHKAKTPRGVYLFVTAPREQFRRFNTPPPFIYPRRLKRWLLQALNRCDRLIANPNGYETGDFKLNSEDKAEKAVAQAEQQAHL